MNQLDKIADAVARLLLLIPLILGKVVDKLLENREEENNNNAD